MGIEWTPTQQLFAKAFIAALTSGLGGFPLYLVGELPEHVMGIAIIFAAGLMSGCSAVLFIEALEVESSITLVILYTFLGMMLVHMISHCVGDIEDFEFAGLKGQSATKALVIVLSMGLHSLGEGVESLYFRNDEIQYEFQCVAANSKSGASTTCILSHDGYHVFSLWHNV